MGSAAVTQASAGVQAADRLERLRVAAVDRGLDAFLATSDESIAYLSGFRPLQLERLFAVVVGPGSSGAIVVPALDLGQVTSAPAALQRVSYEASSDGIPELACALTGARRVGVEGYHLNFARAEALRARALELIVADDVIATLRWSKDSTEISRVRNACELVASALTQMFESLAPGAVEREVNARVESWLRSQGATAAHPLILFGENSANPHAEPGVRELRAGDVVCADLSACLDGYWGDLTRCATVGPASTWAREAWSVVCEAQAAAISACRPGVSAREVDSAQRKLIESRPDLGLCLHGAGHAIGLAVHEPPFLVPRTETALVERMIFTIEPGIYKPGTGGLRLEDDILVGPDGPQLLSAPSPELIELSA
jgi:Xaa-Pro dipeptidase